MDFQEAVQVCFAKYFDFEGEASRPEFWWFFLFVGGASFAFEFFEQQTTIGQLKSDAAKQEATISELKSDLQTVVARLKDQDSKIQRVSAEVEMNKRSPHVVAVNP